MSYGLVELNGDCVEPEQCPCYSCSGEEVLYGESYTNIKQCINCYCENTGQYNCSLMEHCCEYSSWSQWSECDAPCENGYRKRSRNVIKGNLTECDNILDEEECHTNETCPYYCYHEGKKLKWGDEVWSSNPCEFCLCTYNGTIQCNQSTAANVDGSWGNWAQWSTCNKNCTGGFRTRSRLCNDPFPMCNGKQCEGEGTQVENCNTNVNCCEVEEWLEWNPCSHACVSDPNTKSVRNRTRSYVLASDEPYCSETLHDTEECHVDPCNRTCDTTLWSKWTSCNVTCGKGTKTRYRTIISPENTDCKGFSTNETDECHAGDCPCLEPNTIWSNITSCGDYCKYDDKLVCEQTNLYEGCVCAGDYYMDSNGNCVPKENCTRCIVDGKYREDGEEWIPQNDTCMTCYCVNGQQHCIRECEIPTCTEDEELVYPELNTCCPYCEKKIPTCSLKSETKKLYSGLCVTVNPVNVTYCSGTCGLSQSQSLLMQGQSNSESDYINSDCKCCSGTGKTVTVMVDCNGNITTGSYFHFESCSCNTCASIENEEFNSPPAKKRRRRR